MYVKNVASGQGFTARGQPGAMPNVGVAMNTRLGVMTNVPPGTMQQKKKPPPLSPQELVTIVNDVLQQAGSSNFVYYPSQQKSSTLSAVKIIDEKKICLRYGILRI